MSERSGRMEGLGGGLGPDLDQFPDEQLVVFARGGHDRAYAVLFERHRRRLQSCLCQHRYPRALDDAHACEVLQDAFLTAFERIDAYVDTGAGSFRRWLDACVTHAIVQHARATARRRCERAARRLARA